MKWLILSSSLIFSAAASAQLLTPEQALIDAAPQTLSYKGKLLLSGSISVKSCIFENQNSIVVFKNCTKKEAPATNIVIISKAGGLVQYTIENSAAMEARGSISTLSRRNYDRSWSVSFKPTAPVMNNPSLAEVDRIAGAVGGSCYIGGMMQMSPNPTCFSEASEYSVEWENVAVSFWEEPGSIWYQFLRDMRVKVSALPQ